MRSVPALLVSVRLTLNDPLGACVVAEPERTAWPLRLMVQFQCWPARLTSTSPSTSSRPLSAFAFNFHDPCAEQLPWSRTPPPPLWANAAGASTSPEPSMPRASEVAMVLRVLRRIVMTELQCLGG